MGMPGFLRPLGASGFLASGASTVLDPLPSEGAAALAFRPLPVPWAAASVGILLPVFLLAEEAAWFSLYKKANQGEGQLSRAVHAAGSP